MATIHNYIHRRITAPENPPLRHNFATIAASDAARVMRRSKSEPGIAVDAMVNYPVIA